MREVRANVKRVFTCGVRSIFDRVKQLFGLVLDPGTHVHNASRGERALDQQIQTFKALCENTSFETTGSLPQLPSALAILPGSQTPTSGESSCGMPAVNINVHIHLPENKSRRDYEAMIEDIGRYIFGRTDSSRRDE